MLIRRLAVLLTTAALVVGTAPHATAADPASVTITTIGYGHGKGLSQYGARNRANDGQTYRQILRFYYPHTTWGTAGGKIRVLITGDTTDDVVVTARSGLEARSLGSGKTWTLPAEQGGLRVTRWRITASGQSSVLSYRTDSWHAWREAPGDAEFTAGGRPMSLHTPSGVVEYRGALRSASSGTSRNTVDVVGLETYLRGVVPQEVPALWPAAAVRAQAVAARTYAVFERDDVPAGRSYDICDTAACQVYGGASAEQPGSDAAVAATAGRIVTYAGEPAFTQFSASNGGYSVDGGEPYLVAKPDPYDHGIPGDPHSQTFTGDQVTRHWPGLGDLVSVRVLERDGNGAFGGRVLSLRVTGSKSSVTTTGSDFRSYLGLRSTLFKVTNQ